MPADSNTRTLGSDAEDQALEFLTKQACKSITRNYHCRSGEIDLIVEDGETLVFVEVRFRKNLSRGSGAESITRQKMRRIIRTAEHFLLNHQQFRAMPCRFDVISIGDKIDWYQQAFTSDT